MWFFRILLFTKFSIFFYFIFLFKIEPLSWVIELVIGEIFLSFGSHLSCMSKRRLSYSCISFSSYSKCSNSFSKVPPNNFLALQQQHKRRKTKNLHVKLELKVIYGLMFQDLSLRYWYTLTVLTCEIYVAKKTFNTKPIVTTQSVRPPMLPRTSSTW